MKNNTKTRKIIALTILPTLFNLVQTNAYGAPEYPKVMDGYQIIEGDIISNEGASNQNNLWKNGVVYYRFPLGSFTDREISLIESVMSKIENVANIQFETTDGNTLNNYINFVSRSGCYSELGSRKQGQEISLTRDCLNFGVVARQLLHALGIKSQQKDLNTLSQVTELDELDKAELIETYGEKSQHLKNKSVKKQRKSSNDMY